MRAWLMMQLLACTGAGPAADDTAPVAEELPAGWTFSDMTAQSSFDADQAAADIEAALPLVHQVPATPLIDAHLAAVSWGDATCPPLASAGDYRQWLGVCTTEDDTRFSGGVFFYSVADSTLDDAGGFWTPQDSSIPGGTVWTGSVWHGQAYVRGANGQSFMGSGLLARLDGETLTGEHARVNAVSGQYFWDGEGSDDDWLGAGVVPDLLTYTFSDPATGARAVLVSGSLSFETDLGLASVSFDAVKLDDALWNNDCALEPSGALGYRDALGHWSDIRFDVQEGVQTDDAACDGCGRASHDGEDLGEVCIDFEGLYGS